MTAKDLKNALLQEAVQGKLVPQIPSEGNAKDLLEQIKFQKSQMIKEGKIKKEKPLPQISEDEIPFDIPENWCWCRLGEIVNKLTDGTHRTPKYVEKGIPFLSVKNLSSGKMDFENTKFITLEEHKELYSRCNPEKGDMLLTKVGTTGIPVINDSDIEFSLFVSVALLKFSHDLIDEKYFLYLLQSPLVQEQAQENTKGVGNKNWVMDAIAKTILALPPLSEQNRIVAAIEKFMPFIEEYGKKEEVLKDLNAKVGTTTKKAILQEAVQGKLVPQIATEGNAKDLVEQIKSQKAQLIKEGKIKKEKPLPEITEDEIPFDIPENWCWCRFEELMHLLSSKNHQIKQSDILTEGKYPVISQSQNKIEGYYNDSSKMLKNPGIVLVFGDHSRTIKFIDFDFIVGADGTQLIVPIGIDSKYFYYFIKYVIINLPERNYGRHFSLLKSHLVPLPPLSEQKRIVAAIEQLLPLCEKLGK